MVIELHWDLPPEMMGVHELWHPGRRSPSQQTYVMVDTTGPAPFLFGTEQELSIAREWFAQQRPLALIIAVKPPVRGL